MSEKSGADRIGDDLLRGAKAIADELDWTERQVRHAHKKGYIPTFAVGEIIHARRTTLRRHFEALEQKSA